VLASQAGNRLAYFVAKRTCLPPVTALASRVSGDAPRRRSDLVCEAFPLSKLLRPIIALFVLTVAMLSASARAEADCANQIYDTPSPVSSVSPADGGSLSQAPSRAPFTLISSLHGVSLFVRVSTQNVMGNTGVLSDLYQVDFFGLSESSTGSNANANSDANSDANTDSDAKAPADDCIAGEVARREDGRIQHASAPTPERRMQPGEQYEGELPSQLDRRRQLL
jgi:hypothetical protein